MKKVESTLIAIAVGIIPTAQQTAFATNNSTNSSLGTPVATSGRAMCFLKNAKLYPVFYRCQALDYSPSIDVQTLYDFTIRIPQSVHAIHAVHVNSLIYVTSFSIIMQKGNRSSNN